MDIKRITEVGIAVRSLDAATELFENLFAAEIGKIQEVKQYSMRFRMCRVGKVDFEVMESIDEQGVIAEFIKKRGEGLHHIAFAVDDINETISVMRNKGVKFVADAPIRECLDTVDYAGRYFSDEIQFSFSHPASILGILFEFIQYPDGYVAS
jgi:methylmalonyl-CoA/ethylmalonyl-CoA epimerase